MSGPFAILPSPPPPTHTTLAFFLLLSFFVSLSSFPLEITHATLPTPLAIFLPLAFFSSDTVILLPLPDQPMSTFSFVSFAPTRFAHVRV